MPVMRRPESGLTQVPLSQGFPLGQSLGSSPGRLRTPEWAQLHRPGFIHEITETLGSVVRGPGSRYKSGSVALGPPS